MATIATTKAKPPKPLSADRFEQLLAAGAMILLAFVVVALAKGMPHWGKIPATVWTHLGTMIVALALTPVMLLRRRGDRPHRVLGRVWVIAMLLTALTSLAVRDVNHGNFSFIHLLSAWVIIQVPLLWWSARTHRVAQHRSSVRGMVLGALLIAGFFTFPFNRMLGQFLFS
ncbi:MAG: DUF2306 domain-containing protein [Sphingomonas sp.]|nr:DUF2306 domain-containing protein [Sphingomonas sp.]